jgi:DNA repair exonuclease SbcCD ATPase subunit
MLQRGKAVVRFFLSRAQRTKGPVFKVLLGLALVGCIGLGIMLGVTLNDLADARAEGERLEYKLSAASREIDGLQSNLSSTDKQLQQTEEQLVDTEERLLYTEQRLLDTERRLVEAQRLQEQTDRARTNAEERLSAVGLKLSQCESAHGELTQQAEALARRIRKAESESKLLAVKLEDASRTLVLGTLGLTDIPPDRFRFFGSSLVFDHDDLVRKHNELVDAYNDLVRRFNACVDRSSELEDLVNSVSRTLAR